ncbi:MAG: Mur ligase family protein, partial [Clostridia bacterium]
MMFEKKCVLVYGFSKSGRAATELLLKKGAKVLIYDDKEVNGDIPIGARIVSDLKCAITEADLIVISPAVPYNHSLLEQARLAGKQVVGELELAYNFCDCGLIAITGTNGKTTTTLLINEILNRSGRTSYALGNIGIPFSEKVLELSQSDT